ncbi:MAG: cytochrome C, partial [Candidatus Dadabacteria bacterium]
AALVPTAALAGLVVLGEGDARRFDPSGFPPDMQKRYALMEQKCNNPAQGCHALGRVVEAVTTGVAPVSGSTFDKKAAKMYGIKMMRKPDSGIDKADAKELVKLLYFLLDEAKR